MTDQAEIQSLFEAVRNAPPGPCPQITERLMMLTYVRDKRSIGATCNCCPNGQHQDLVWVDPKTDRWVTDAITGFEFLADTDRALLLARRFAPDWSPNIRRAGSPEGEVWWISKTSMPRGQVHTAEQYTPARAIVEAMLVFAGAVPPKGGQPVQIREVA